ncbi:MAG: hypothetical protein ABI972_22745 [Acidobacteriota bacterium]
MRIAQWIVRIALIFLCICDLWLMSRIYQFGPGLLAESASGGTIRLLPVQWAAAGYVWLGGLISVQLLLVAVELVLQGKLRRRHPVAGVSPTR